MKKLLIAVLLIIVVNAELYAQQMIPKQIGFEISYSVFPGSPEKQNYVLALGLVSYKHNGNFFLD